MAMYDPPRPFPFDRASGLGSEVPTAIYLYQNLTPREDFVWRHLFVKKSSMVSFRAAFRDTQVGLLPFGCMCAGGKVKHAHLIAVGPKKTFHLFWNRVHSACTTTSKKNGPKSKGSEPIGSVWHLLNTVFYVGRRMSRCAGKLVDGCPSRDMHYLILRPLAPHAKMYAFMLIPEGWQRWATIKMGKCYLHGLDFRTVKEIGLKEMKKKTKNLFVGCYVPLSPGYRESDVGDDDSLKLYDPDGKPIRFVVKENDDDNDASAAGAATTTSCCLIGYRLTK
ncbi:hypothetical protein RF55_21813 [Lasius niger]|uniref:Uncharacterized protein n=1 Tax=Lasius niger TaxID=67767 RepID=A0A0J7MQG3_LASNI|nr:hypothetical protein RF55_21813 [Lasius niger]